MYDNAKYVQNKVTDDKFYGHSRKEPQSDLGKTKMAEGRLELNVKE